MGNGRKGCLLFIRQPKINGAVICKEDFAFLQYLLISTGNFFLHIVVKLKIKNGTFTAQNSHLTVKINTRLYFVHAHQ